MSEPWEGSLKYTGKAVAHREGWHKGTIYASQMQVKLHFSQLSHLLSSFLGCFLWNHKCFININLCVDFMSHYKYLYHVDRWSDDPLLVWLAARSCVALYVVWCGQGLLLSFTNFPSTFLQQGPFWSFKRIWSENLFCCKVNQIFLILNVEEVQQFGPCCKL